MLKIVTVVGARPQFVKAAIVSLEIAKSADIQEIIVHTGQHYDENMSQVFFDELDIPRPKYNLHVGSGTHGQQTGKILIGISEILENEQPDALLVYGDTNSTLAGALAASKMKIPIFHVEAGLRSFNRAMPEEINRVLTDHISKLLFCPTDIAVQNLALEGVTEGVFNVGDVMYDASSYFGEFARDKGIKFKDSEICDSNYVLLTCHRAENTDSREKLSAILGVVNELAQKHRIVFPIHPRTQLRLEHYGLTLSTLVRVIAPVSYLEMLVLQENAKLIVTDSGGLQKEAFFCGVPCVTLRDETEWSETIQSGANILAGTDQERILLAVESQLFREESLPDAAGYYGNGQACFKIINQISELIENRNKLHTAAY